MRTNPVTRLFALVLTLMLILIVPAAAETCALCGRESGSDAYLCTACLLELMDEQEVAGGLAVTGAVYNEDGSVTLSWSDSAGNGPYSVYYELMERAPRSFGWTAARGFHGTSITLTRLVPGTSYTFIVKDSAGNEVEHAYYAPAVKNGNEIGAKIRIHTKLRNGRNVLEYPWSASEIELDNGKEHGLYMKLAYSMLRKTRHYAFSLSVEAPNGFADVVYSGDIVLNYGKSEVPAWGFIALDDYFSYLERYYDGVPTGEYKVTINFDGKPIYTVPFNVSE